MTFGPTTAREKKSRRFSEAHPSAVGPTLDDKATNSRVAESTSRSRTIANKLNLELCAGSAGYSAKISKIGLSTLPVDNEHNRHKQKFHA